MSSQVFRGPTPIMENNCIPPFKLATALLETAAGMGGILGSSAASRRTAPRVRRRKASDFFIAEILRLREDVGKDLRWPVSRRADLQSLQELAGSMAKWLHKPA